MIRTAKLPDYSDFHVLSDLHLRHPTDARTQIFLKYLEDLKVQTITRPQALFLLGDIFDFIHFVSGYHREFWTIVFEAIADLKNRGIHVYFIEGNHDFGFEHAPHSLKDLFFAQAGDFCAHFKHPKLGSIELRHGDDVVCPPSYHAFRALVKNKQFQTITSLVPGAMTYFLFSKYAQISRTKDKYRALDPRFFYNCAQNYLAQRIEETGGAPTHLFLGHVHVWISSPIQNTHVHVGPDWFSAPSVLKVTEEGTFERVWLDATKTAKIFEPCP